MNKKTAQSIILYLAEIGIEIETGLNDEEIHQIEKTFQFRFPPDIKLLWQTGLPIADRFVNWRLGIKSEAKAQKIQGRLDWPLKGVLFDIEHNDFWDKTWGVMPNDLVEKFTIAKKYLTSCPKLIPVYSHRYIPSRPSEVGNPIFSVMQMDIIYYGYDLENYFSNEFGFSIPEQRILKKPIREIEFWSSWVCGSA